MRILAKWKNLSILNLLEVAGPLPIGDGPIITLLLCFEKVKIMVDHVAAKGPAREIAPFKDGYGVTQGRGNAGEGRGRVHVAIELSRRFYPVPDPVQPGGKGRGESEVWIDIG